MISCYRASQVALVVDMLPANAGDVVSIPGLERSPGVGNGNPPQYSCLENAMDRGAWQHRVHEVAKGRTWLSTHSHIVLQIRDHKVQLCLAYFISIPLYHSTFPCCFQTVMRNLSDFDFILPNDEKVQMILNSTSVHFNHY